MAISSITTTEPASTAPKAAPVETKQVAAEGKQLKNDRAAQDAEAAKAAEKTKAAKPVSNTLGRPSTGTLNVTA